VRQAAAVPHSPKAPTVLQSLPENDFIGGCRAHMWRGSYTFFNGVAATACNEHTPTRMCGGSYEPAQFPSGMQLPRHNVPQYMGNGVWDALARDGFGRLLGAMMGDPFAFVVAPEVDALRRLLMDTSLTPQTLAAQLDRAWSIDTRYEGTESSRGTRQNFLNAISGVNSTAGGLSRAFILNSESWARMGPPAVKRRIEQALRGSVSLSPEAATCAAIHMMDTMFSQRGQVSVFNDLPSSAEDMIAAPATNVTMFEELYRQTPSVLPDEVREDPHNVIYTSPYQHNANGWYGGNMSVKFSPTIGGSGIDTKWAIYRGCPMAGREREFCRNRQLWTNENGGERTPACDVAATDCAAGPSSTVSVDQGEMRTPHYKAPNEVLGLSWFNWNTEHHCIFHQPGPLCPQYVPIPGEGEGAGRDITAPDGMDALKFDMTSLIRPTQWSLHRAEPDLPGSVYIAFPRALAEPTYGVDFHEEGGTFTAAPSPPLSWGVETLVRSENFIAPDLPHVTDTYVPTWGVLYPCARTNLPVAYHEPTPASGEIEPIRCSAMRRLKATWGRWSFDPVYSNLYNAVLPTQWEEELAALRIWTPGSVVDLAAGEAGATRPAHGEQRQVCVLSFAAAVRLDASRQCSQ